MNVTKIIDNLLLSKDLRDNQSLYAMRNLLDGKLDQMTAKSLLVLLHRKGETSKELTPLIKSARKKNVGHRLPKSKIKNLCDACGTGGDGKRTFNISTISSFVAAGAGSKVAKHGNRSITSSCGSSDLIEALGINLETPAKKIIRSIERAGIGYFHAPVYNQAFANVQGIRKELAAQKIKTIFNMAGPLLNPMNVKRQLIGVYHPRLISIILNTLKKLGSHHALVISGKNGADELCTNQITYAGELKNGKIHYFIIKPSRYRLRFAGEKTMRGSTVKANRKIALGILSGADKSPRLDVVLANTALILYVSKNAEDFAEGIKKARDAIRKGKALSALKQMRRITHAA